MAFGLYSLLEAGLLVLNAMCVLHEERFLAKVGHLLSTLSSPLNIIKYYVFRLAGPHRLITRALVRLLG